MRTHRFTILGWICLGAIQLPFGGRLRLCLGFLLASLFAAPVCLAETAGAMTHNGFYLRLNLASLGFGSAQAEQGGLKLKVTGLAGVGDLGIGGAVTENLILHGNIFGPVLVNPTLTSNGNDVSTDDTNVNAIGFGGGITYYFMPINFYVTLILGIAKMKIEVNNETQGDTEFGFSTQLSLGKEWWVSENWGLGVGTSFAFQAMKDKDNGSSGAPVWTVFSGAVVFSATYN